MRTKMNSVDEQKNFENAKLLYEVSKFEYESELSRSARLDEKVNKILTFESVIIVAFTALTTNSKIIDLLNDKYDINLIFSYGLIVIFFIVISISLYILIDCLALRNMEKLHVDDAMSIRIGGLDNPSAYIEVVANYSKITEKNKDSNDYKAEKLFKNHRLIFVALFVICLYASSLLVAFISPNKPKLTHPNVSDFGLLTVYLYFSELSGNKMSEDNASKDNSSQQQTSQASDPAVVFSFANKQQHSTNVALEDFTGAGGNLLLEEKLPK